MVKNNNNKKIASHPSSIRAPDTDFRKLVNKLAQAEITRKLEKTEKLEKQYLNNIQKTTSQINNIQHCDNDSAKKFTQTLNIYKKHDFYRKNLNQKKCNHAVEMNKALPNADKNNKTKQINHQNT